MSQTFQIKTLKCEKVVVFADRAEVKRSFKVKLNKGENEVIIANVSNLIDQDSVRVEGHGDASVLDVVCQSKRIQIDKADLPEKTKKLQAEIKEYENKQKILDSRNDRLLKQQNVLNEYANTMSKQGTQEKTKNESTSDSTSINNFLNFLEIYGKRIEQLDNEKMELTQEINQNKDLLNTARANLNKLNASNFTDTLEITILLEAKKDDTDVSLNLSYVISNASWTPKYDIRVYSDNKTMIVNYFGLIRQSTGEDWNDTNVSLSTAVPSIGGNVPELETLNVKVKPKFYSYAKSKRGFALPFGGSAMMKSTESVYESRSMCLADIDQCAPLRIETTQVKESLIASTFDIPRQTTIPSDNTTHKVSIGVINLKPEFEYETVPKKNPHAFLKAKVKNTSSYAMLAGPANVFLDNNFVAKTELKSYSPQEEFTCSLGVDPSIRVDYKPVRKFQEESGLLSKTKSTKYEQVIEIKNTTSNQIKILLSDQLPLSNDDKIQVKLIEPVLKNNQIVTLNKSNNLEFDLKISAGKQEVVTIKYSVDHPSSEEIEFN